MIRNDQLAIEYEIRRTDSPISAADAFAGAFALINRGYR